MPFSNTCPFACILTLKKPCLSAFVTPTSMFTNVCPFHPFFHTRFSNAHILLKFPSVQHWRPWNAWIWSVLSSVPGGEN